MAYPYTYNHVGAIPCGYPVAERNKAYESFSAVRLQIIQAYAYLLVLPPMKRKQEHAR
jgi:hypothetical protein